MSYLDYDFRFNRTFMELKLEIITLCPLDIAGFNRTFMELKQISLKRVFCLFSIVLIAPLWN